MFSKILTIVLVATVLARLGLMQWKGLGRWFERFVDVTLVVLAVVYGVQLVVILSR